MATPITPIQTHRVTDHLLTSKDESIFTIKIDPSPSDSISSSAQLGDRCLQPSDQCTLPLLRSRAESPDSPGTVAGADGDTSISPCLPQPHVNGGDD